MDRRAALVWLPLCLACTKSRAPAEPEARSPRWTSLSTTAASLLEADGDAAALVELKSGHLVFAHHPAVLAERAMPPGSVMKLVAALALLEAGRAEASYTCRGQHRDGFGVERPCWNREGHGELRLRTALALSCNAWFYEQAPHLRWERYRSLALELGIGAPWAPDQPPKVLDELPPAVPERELPDVIVGDHPSVRVTPLSLLRAVSVIATRGLLVEPSFSGPGPRRQTTLDRGALELLALGMEEATQSGTLLGALPPEVAAKTGTAPRPGGLGTRGFVVGYFPIGRPRYAFVVVKDRGRGAKDAAPFARAMVAAELRP